MKLQESVEKQTEILPKDIQTKQTKRKKSNKPS